MNTAAILSITLRRLARLTSAAISERSAATVESRSSQKTTWLPLNFFCSLCAKSRTTSQRSPCVPFMFFGKPTMKVSVS